MQSRTQKTSPGTVPEDSTLPQLKKAEMELTPEFIAAHIEAPAQQPSGGDFLSTFPLQNESGDIGVIIGDVSGHGPEQTAQADHMRELLSDCLSAGLTPAETLKAVNAIIEPDPNFEGFGTVFVGTLEAETGKLVYSSGGHEPGLIAKPDSPEKVEELEGTGPPVGAFPPDMARFEQQEASVAPGATLLLYTDGVSDAHPPQDRKNWLGIDRLKQMLGRFAALPPLRLVSTLLRRVAAFCHWRFDDDVAVVAVRRRSRHSKSGRAKDDTQRDRSL
jgi:sigma-B regulation protein RsbU (phosphoserine phosphatase)